MDYESVGYGFGASSSSTVTAGSRTHVAFVRNELLGYFYINCASADSISSQAGVSYTNIKLSLGADIRDLVNYFKGTIDNVQIFGVVLLPSQINRFIQQLSCHLPNQYTSNQPNG